LALHVCARGDGIRRSKDLRAEIGKFPNSTNERKIMSKKTMKQRISVVLASVLTAGFFSAVSAPQANAAGVAFGSFAGTVYCQSLDAAGDVVALTGNVRYLTVPSGADITFVIGTDQAETIMFSGPLNFVSSTASVTSEYTLSADNSIMTILGAAGGAADTVTVRAGAVGTATIKSYTTTDLSTAVDTVTITVIASCATGNSTYSESNSAWEWATADQALTGATTTASTESVYSYVNADTAHLSLYVKNSFNAFMAAGTWTANATGGCALDMNTTSGSSSLGLLSSDALTGQTGDGIFVQVGQNAANENKPVNCVVSVYYNDLLINQKTISIAGTLASIVVSAPTVAKIGITNYRNYTVNAYDSAGTRIQVTPTVDSAGLNTFVTNVVPAQTSLTGSTTTGNAVTCGAVAGSAKVRLKSTNADLVTIYSNEWTVNCAGAARTYTASLDKASYTPGEIATLTVTAKDISGNLVFGAGADAIGDSAPDTVGSQALGATTLHAIAGGQMDIVTAVAATDIFVNGVKTYQFKVGTTEGSYAMSVNLPDITTDTAKTITYKIASATPSVSNADVLKSIVSLIASINKQIQALQKLILKR